MVRETFAHAKIAQNILSVIRTSARERGCQAIGGFLVETSEASAYEPDALVLCAPTENLRRRTNQPTIVFEVLSPSTLDFDRAAKARGYRALASLRQLVFVYQDSVRIESWLRQDGDWGHRPEVLLERKLSLALPAIAASVSLDDVYADVVPSPLID